MSCITCFQVRLYGDGADAQQHFELMSLLAVVTSSSSTLDSRIALSVRNCNRTTAESRQIICTVIAWSFHSLRYLDLKLKWQEKTWHECVLSIFLSPDGRMWSHAWPWSLGSTIFSGLLSRKATGGKQWCGWAISLCAWRYTRWCWLCGSNVWVEKRLNLKLEMMLSKYYWHQWCIDCLQVYTVPRVLSPPGVLLPMRRACFHCGWWIRGSTLYQLWPRSWISPVAAWCIWQRCRSQHCNHGCMHAYLRLTTTEEFVDINGESALTQIPGFSPWSCLVFY